jgi:hypothetical protein
MVGVIAIKHTQLGIQTKTVLFPIIITVRWKCMYHIYIYLYIVYKMKRTVAGLLKADT